MMKNDLAVRFWVLVKRTDYVKMIRVRKWQFQEVKNEKRRLEENILSVADRIFLSCISNSAFFCNQGNRTDPQLFFMAAWRVKTSDLWRGWRIC